MNKHLQILPEIQLALKRHQPIVALESAVITHGLPYPENVKLAHEMEAQVRSQHAIPATTAILDGKIRIGLTVEDTEHLGHPDTPSRKISRRDFGIAIHNKLNGGTTVTGTLITAHLAGIQVFATGGIGGVHRDAPFDISADLKELSQTPLIVVCAGAKSILDLPATIEYLETMGVPILGYQTDEFPAFFSRSSGLPVNARIETPAEAVEIALAQWELGLSSAALVVVPPPAETALDSDEVEKIIRQALEEAHDQKITGAAVTPYLLKRVNELSRGASLRANLDLLKNNARVAALTAVEMALRTEPKRIV